MLPNAIKIIDFAMSDPNSHQAISIINKAVSGNCFLVGGVVRDSFFYDEVQGDIDIMINNYDIRAYTELDKLGVPYVITRHGNRRYFYNNLQIDLFQPIGFYKKFNTVEETLCYFDLKINAIAVSLKHKNIIDPLNGLFFLQNDKIGLNKFRWNSPNMKDHEVYILLIRLLKILGRIPNREISFTELNIIKATILKADLNSWPIVQDRFPDGPLELINRINNLIHTITINSKYKSIV